MLVFTQCCDDEVPPPPSCEIECQNGGTVDTTVCYCECPEGYEGDSCEVEIPPSIVKITGIRIIEFPETNSGDPWDPTLEGNDRRPDLQVDVYLFGDDEALGTTLTRDNALAGVTYSLTINTSDNCIFLSDAFATFRVILYDFDGPLAHQRRQMTSGEYIPYQEGGGFPETVTVNGPNFVAELDVEYLR